MKLSEIYGIHVVAADGAAGGYVIKIYTDGEKITGFLCADERENELYVPSENARFANNGIIFTRSEKAKPTATPLALGRRCYNACGGYVGVLKDVNCRGFRLTTAKIGTKSYAADNLVLGDIVIIKHSALPLKADVTKNGKVLFKSGEYADKKLLERAISLGEYVQTNLKTI